MNEHLLQLFAAYKETKYYNNSSTEINLAWLADKLDSNDLEELEKQIVATLLENEEELFIGCLKYVWRLFKELSSDLE